MKAIVIIPYSPRPNREGPLQRVKDHLATTPWDYVIAFDEHKPFRHGKAMNEAIRRTSADMLIMNDADTIAPLEQMLAAVQLAEDQPGLVFAFTDYIRLNEDGSRGMKLHDPAGHVCAAITRECFDEVGGYDEGYVGWGMEDRDFNRRVEKLWPIRRVPGEVIHYWHGERRHDDSDLDTPPELVAANWARFKANA